MFYYKYDEKPAIVPNYLPVLQNLLAQRQQLIDKLGWVVDKVEKAIIKEELGATTRILEIVIARSFQSTVIVNEEAEEDDNV